MATLLFISPTELASTTILGGNVDIDKYQFTIEQTQIMVIEPLLGSELYDKIVADVTATTITGLYATLYNEFVKPITKYQSMAEYIEISSYTLDNAGLIKISPDNTEIVDKDEAQMLSQKYSALAQKYIYNFSKWICKNNLPEYKTVQDEVNAQRYMKLTGGLWFGDVGGLTEDELGFND